MRGDGLCFIFEGLDILNGRQSEYTDTVESVRSSCA
jgi:hypothetical protein